MFRRALAESQAWTPIESDFGCAVAWSVWEVQFLFLRTLVEGHPLLAPKTVARRASKRKF
jgi:hypothetical protein